ncbi:MAG: patatin-like phospholipase family protein [Clostridia bacterium]|nr:patatin-like phospholipase family protein [Clostridia bacterium]
MKEKPIKISKKLKLGLALSGGGGLGVAHIGAIKAFEELGVSFDYVAGTSAGSMVGALYASGMSSEQMLEIAENLKVSDIRSSMFILKPSSAETIEKLMNKLFGKELVFSELKKPLTIVSTDMKTGREIHLNSGSVAKAVSASCAVPGIFKPVIYNDMHLVDGGLKNNLPTDVVRQMGANVVIAVELNFSRGFGTEKLGMLDILKSSVGIMMESSVESKLALADIVIQPDMRAFAKTNLKRLEERIDLGYQSVMASKSELLEIFSSKPDKQKVKYAKKIQNK